MNTSSTWTSLRARVGDYLGSPSVLALCVVALVTLVGSIATALSYRALCRQGEARAESDLRNSATQVRGSIELALEAADPMLDRLQKVLRDVEPDKDPEALLSRMRGLSTARRGLARLSVSFPDGRHFAVRRGPSGTPYAELVYQLESGAIRKQWSFDQQGELELQKTERSDYDPRTRGFYQWALARGKRSWTTPYLFLPTFDTGITRVEPLFDLSAEPPVLRAVLTVDFDTTGLDPLLGAPLTAHERKLVIDARQSILAASGVKLPHLADASRRDSLSWAELTDPVLVAARSHTAELSYHRAKSIKVQGRSYRISSAHIVDLAGDPISLVIISPEAELFADARREAQLGMLMTSLTALGGLMFALFLSENISRLRRKRAEAELGERIARDELKQLGSYELVAPIKTGGMGEVYRARHRLLARDAALKLIRTESKDDDPQAEHDRERFFCEARALASLHSVHTVAVYDFGVASDGRYFLAMELLDGFDLHELVDTYGRQPAGRVASILAQICDSLGEAHAKGLVHRDLKPANVFLCRKAEWLDLIKVLDFGLTRPTGVAEERSISGTPGYMAPEQALGLAVTAKADLYGVGCVGYWLLSGKSPPRAERREQVLLDTSQAEPSRLPDDVRDRTPAALEQLITRCMARDPAHRPVSAQILARALHAVAAEASADFTESMLQDFWRGAPSLEVKLSRIQNTPALLGVTRPHVIEHSQAPETNSLPRDT